jgi:hypothetical protein
MKTIETNNTFPGILADEKTVMDSFRKAGVKVRIVWQFGEPVEVEDGELAEDESDDEGDFSLPILNSVLNPRSFFLQ